MRYQSITTGVRLREYCRHLAGRPSIAFDTEFVAEHSYRPVLCLIQVAAGDSLAVIDALEVGDVGPFWETVAGGGHETIVHAGRSEIEFCRQAAGRPPAGLFDVQVAAGFAGLEYPAGYVSLVDKLLGETAAKHETRTDWRRRPLSKRQIEYALEDVVHLQPIRDKLVARLQSLGRLAWFEEEMQEFQEEVERAASADRWRRMPGAASLSPRAAAIARELFHWREQEAERRNQPVRRVLRDDLIIELARRGTADAARIGAVRGMERGDLRRRLGEIAAAIERARALPDDQCPKPPPRERVPQYSVLGQFLFAALGSYCRQSDLAPGLVGGPNDIRELIAQRTHPGKHKRRPPRIARGWRKQFIGELFDELLSGQVAIRIADPDSEHPLRFERPGDGGR